MARIITIPNDSIIYEIDLDLYKKTDNDTVKAIQYDKNKRYIVATIWNNGIQYPLTENHTIEFRTTKPSGFGVDNTCDIDEQGRIVYQITEQTTIESGLFKAEFKISDEDGNIRPFLFNIFVEKSALQNDTVVSTPEVNILDNLIQDATTAITNMNGLSEEVREAINDADEAISNTNSSANYANEQGNYAKGMGDFALQKSQQVDSVLNDVNDTINNVNQITDALNQLSQDIIITENEREVKESLREIHEEERQNFYESSNKLETYSDTVEYVVNNKVTYQGGTYQCIINCIGIIPSFNNDNAYWKCIAAKGDKGIGERGEQGIQGIQGKSYISKGNWDSNISYTNDTTTISTVLHNGSTYSCIESHISSISNQPPNSIYWQLIAQKGVDGLGAGDMTESVYDPQGRKTDIFKYIDEKESDLPDNILHYSPDSFEPDSPTKRDSDLLDGKPREYYEGLASNVESLLMVKLEDKLDIDGDSKYNTVTFNESDTEDDLDSGLNHSTLWKRVKNKFNNLIKHFYSLQGGIKIPAGADLNDPKYLVTGNYYCLDGAIASTLLNAPPFKLFSGFVMKVYYSNGVGNPVQMIKVHNTSEYYERTYIDTLSSYGVWIRYLSTVDIVNNDTVGGDNKVASAEIVKELGEEIDTLNNNFEKLFQSRLLVSNETNWNTLVEAGTYRVVGVSGINAPSSSYMYGILLVFKYSTLHIVHIYFPHEAIKLPVYRVCFDNHWLPWRTFA